MVVDSRFRRGIGADFEGGNLRRPPLWTIAVAVTMSRLISVLLAPDAEGSRQAARERSSVGRAPDF